MQNSSFLQSPEFNRAMGNATDTGIKIFFKWVNILIAGLANFAKTAVKSIFGK